MMKREYNESENCILIKNNARCWWLTPVILATREAEITRFAV
jgi:hypothetical protein